MNKSNPLEERSLQLAINCKKYSELLDEQKQYSQSNQFQRCSSSIGANIAEAQRAASRKDFVNKLRIASKELSETKYWLQLFKAIENYPETSELIKQTIEIEYILNTSIATAIRNGKNK